MNSLILFTSLFAAIASGAPCANEANFPAELKGATIPLVQSSVAFGFEISGKLQIVDKCNFQPKEFTLKASAVPIPQYRIRFYGIPSDPTKPGFPLTEAYFDKAYNNEDGPVLALNQKPGTLADGISFKDFVGFRAFAETMQIVVGEGNYTQAVKPDGTPANTGNTNANGNNKSSAMYNEAGILFAAFVALVGAWLA